MYLSKSQNIFVQRGRNVWASMAIDGEQRAVRRQVSVPAPQTLQDVFVQITKCICPNHEMYLSSGEEMFGQVWL